MVTSASDLTLAATCEFAFLRTLDAKLGRDVVVPVDDDPMLARAARLGDAHEARVLARYRDRYGDAGVVAIERPERMEARALTTRAEETRAALLTDARVVFQATFYDPVQRPGETAQQPTIAFLGFADFLERVDASSRTWHVHDTKLARRARTTALMQLAAYAEQVQGWQIPVADQVVLLLGDDSRSVHALRDIAPLFRARRDRMHGLIDASWARGGSAGQQASAAPISWGSDGVSACGRCVVCAPEVSRSRDPLLIAGVRMHQRELLRQAGLTTIDAVAESLPKVRDGLLTLQGINQRVLHRLAAQASVQVRGERSTLPVFEIVEREALSALPEPDEGDIFFDFEGDPMFLTRSDAGAPIWGIDYLFGLLTAQGEYLPFWAHSLEDERQALIDFMRWVGARREQYPNMRIYHYASYERTHLLSIAARHGVQEREVDELLRDHVLVDLYPIVRRALLIGANSYSIKKLEPLYMHDELRDDTGVTTGAASVTAYATARELSDSPHEEDREDAARQLAAIADYNRYDCLSTLRLRDWLRSLDDAGSGRTAVAEFLDTEEQDSAGESLLSPLGGDLLAAAESFAHAGHRAERDACALAASAIDYHEREQKSFWWSHFERLVAPVEEWADTKDVLIAAEGVQVLADWHRPPRARTEHRLLGLLGSFAPGSTVREGAQACALYDSHLLSPGRVPGERSPVWVTIEEITEHRVIVRERLRTGTVPYHDLPVALTPGPPPPALTQKPAIEEWGATIAAAVGSARNASGELETDAVSMLPADPVLDLMRRVPPRLQGGRAPVSPESEEARRAGGSDEHRVIGAVTTTLLALDRSYLAVQGPPGTGKTYLAAHVIRTLVERHGWRVGVVAQSHRVVENVLEAVVRAGVDPSQVGKAPQRGGGLSPGGVTPAYTLIEKDATAAFIDGWSRAQRGSVVGGTAWDFSHPGRFPRRGLDLLVIDEAGQFSLASTTAATVSTTRLLLLGDPGQLPQVSQGTHPEPIDTSALGWLLAERETLPAEFGYFLAETRRMHPALCAVVSELSYEGRLRAHPSTAQLETSGLGEPGLRWHPVTHTGNTTSSPEEAEAVAVLVDQALGARLSEGNGSRRVTHADIIVVAPYNAQVDCVRSVLSRAGHDEVRVGTVDKFQGQEALIAIVTLAASSLEDVPRGTEFLLMRNRLNVAISRARWAAHLVSSASLGTTGLPQSVDAVAALSAYLRLTEHGSGYA